MLKFFNKFQIFFYFNVVVQLFLSTFRGIIYLKNFIFLFIE